jgi:hypothetical protein
MAAVIETQSNTPVAVVARIRADEEFTAKGSAHTLPLTPFAVKLDPATTE